MSRITATKAKWRRFDTVVADLISRSRVPDVEPSTHEMGTEDLLELADLIQTMGVALSEIARMGDGIKSNMIDWANCGKNAKYLANTALKEPKR